MASRKVPDPENETVQKVSREIKDRSVGWYNNGRYAESMSTNFATLENLWHELKLPAWWKIGLQCCNMLLPHNFIASSDLSYAT